MRPRQNTVPEMKFQCHNILPFQITNQSEMGSPQNKVYKSSSSMPLTKQLRATVIFLIGYRQFHVKMQMMDKTSFYIDFVQINQIY